MWKNSKPADYLSFRVFIFGITSQSMFPNGVVYEGINDNKPMFFRGESGANDAIVCMSLSDIRIRQNANSSKLPIDSPS